MPDAKVRPARRGDEPALREVLASIELFPADMLDGMIAPFHSGGQGHRWLVVEDGEAPVGFAYCEPERMTDGTHNMLAIGVRADRQGFGLGTALIEALERDLVSQGQRVLLIETSGSDAYARTRSLYARRGYVGQARIPEFYAAGEDKIVFWKKLA